MLWPWRKPPPPHPLDTPLFRWTERDPFKIRDLLASIAVLGRTWSGKTSTSGKFIAQAIVDHPNSCGLRLLPMTQDRSMWEDIFRKTNRLDDMLVVDAEAKRTTNFLRYLGGQDAR